jgi:hypothetical protein
MKKKFDSPSEVRAKMIVLRVTASELEELKRLAVLMADGQVSTLIRRALDSYTKGK